MNSSITREALLVEGAYKAAYLGADFVRLASYRQQLQYVARQQHRSALLVGRGDGIVPQLIKDLGIDVVVLDVNPHLKPDLLGSVEQIPAPDKSYDICVCCQVLEHLPFERFSTCLKEIGRVANKLVLSLPDVRRYGSMRLRLGRWKWEFCIDLPRLRRQVIPVENLKVHGHYWEIGYRGYGLERIKATLAESKWRVLEYRRVPDLAWHTFFYCEIRP